MPRFVVLTHDHPRGLHWDFMLQTGDRLATWALSREPALGEQIAERLPDHRPAYLDYEGPVSGDRGQVARWDHGDFHIERQSDDEWIVRLAGARLAGRVALARLEATHQKWRFTYESTKAARNAE